MGFDIADLESYKTYQAKLKTEANKVKQGHFVLFDKYKFKEGNKPLLLVGPKPDKGLEKFITTAGAKVKARGSCVDNEGTLSFTAEQGTIGTAEIRSFGISGQVADDTGQEAEVKKEEKQEQTEVAAEEKPTTPPTPFQKVTPSRTQPQSDIKIGTETDRTEKAQVAEFVKQRRDLLEFAKAYLETMTELHNRASAVASVAQELIDRADKGERSEQLAGRLDGALRNAQEILGAAQNAYETNGKEVAKGRQVNPGKYIKNAQLAKATGKTYKAIFLEVAKTTQQATKAIDDIELMLGEAIRGMELVLPLVRTGRADLANLLAYLDKNAEAIQGMVDQLEKAVKIDSVNFALDATLRDQRVGNDELQEKLEASEETVANRQRVVDESYPRIQALCKSGLLRLKQGPQNDTRIQERFAAIKGSLEKATGWKRTFDEGKKAFAGLAQQAKDRLGQSG